MVKDGILRILILNLIGSCMVFGGVNQSRSADRSEDLCLSDVAFRLPSNTRPIEYWLKISPDTKKRTFGGKVTIQIRAEANTQKITMHSNKLVIENVSIWTRDETRQIESSFNLNLDCDILEINTNESIEGDYIVIVKFKGNLEKSPFGFALHKWVEKQIKYEYIVATLFEPIFARRAFPCYDEPQFRTPFTLYIEKPLNQNVLSLTHFSQEKSLVTFAKTDPIPTHVLAYAIFDNKGYYENTKGIYTIWTRNNERNQVSYALDIIPEIFEEMGHFTNVPLQSQKMDFIIIPSKMGQNETRWETMFYLEKDILCVVGECSQEYQQRVTTNLVRQISYKWFGEYVSIESWKFFWLKHGFANYFQFELTELIDPSWELSDFLGSLQMQTALFTDNKYFSKPLTADLNMSSENIFQMYKYWPYTFIGYKASLIIRMLEQIVGKSTFKRAIQRFLNICREERAGLMTPNDLWKAFDDQIKADELVLPGFSRSSMSISLIMKPYTTLPGYPLILANKASENKIDIFQIPYFDTEADNKWYIPITITTRSELNFQVTMPISWSITYENFPVTVSIKDDEWYILNVKNTAYCRVHYRDNNWNLLIKQLHEDPNVIHRLNRAQLITDSHHLAIDGKIPSHIPIVLSAYLYKEENPMVWMTAFRSFKRFYAAISEDLRPLYKNHFVKCLEHEYRRTGFQIKTSDTRVTKMWRSEMLTFLCWIRHTDCVQKAKDEYQQHKSDLIRINADLQYVVWCTMLRVNSKSLIKGGINLSNISCHKDVFNAASYCSLSPIKNEEGLLYTYNNLSSLLAKEKDDMRASILEMMNHWDFSVSILKMIEKEVDKFCNSNFSNEFKIKKLTKLVECLTGIVSGKAEFDIVKRIHDTANTLNPWMYIDLRKAINSLYSITNAEGIHMKEDNLKTILDTHGCPSVENNYDDKDVLSSLETVLKFFDENVA